MLSTLIRWACATVLAFMNVISHLHRVLVFQGTDTYEILEKCK